MKRTLVSCLTAAVLLSIVHRVPAPISEVETPTPAPKQSAKPKAKHSATPVASEKPKAKSAPVSDDHKLHSYAGTWRGAITCGSYQNVEHVIVIDSNEKTMTVTKMGPGGVNGSAAAFVGADGLTVKFGWPNGTWALKPNPDGQTAHVRLTSFLMDNSAIFRRANPN